MDLLSDTKREPLDFENELDEVKLENELQQIMEKNDLLMKENEVFVAHLYRRGQTDQAVNENIDVKETDSRMLSASEKLDTVEFELSSINADIKELADHATRDITLLNEVLEESAIRSNEIKKDAYEFRRDLVLNSDAPRDNISAERLIRYFEEKIAAKTLQFEKLQAKNNTIKLAIQKCDQQIKQKSEAGDNLHKIDFQQLQIENSQYNAKIDQRNKQLLKLKMTTGKTVQILNNGKTELAALLNESSRTKRDIIERETQIVRLTSELQRVQADVKASKQTNRRYEDRLGRMDMPLIMDYVKQKMDEHDLLKMVKNWERKVEIAEIGAKKNVVLDKKLDLKKKCQQKANAKIRAAQAEFNAHEGQGYPKEYMANKL